MRTFRRTHRGHSGAQKFRRPPQKRPVIDFSSGRVQRNVAELGKGVVGDLEREAAVDDAVAAVQVTVRLQETAVDTVQPRHQVSDQWRFEAPTEN